MRNAKYYVTISKNLDEALAKIHNDAIQAVKNWLCNLNDSDLVEILQEYKGNTIHPMEDLDDELRDFTPTEILETCVSLDLGDEYFNSETWRSGNNIWDVANITSYDMAEELYDMEFDFDDPDMEYLMEEVDDLIYRVTKQFKYLDTAKQLFDMAMEKDPDQVIQLLWNMYNE